ncbi:MAG: O-glycosyl hydrolase [Pirellulaceae bacterium]|jgi:O-glycosyl hydrolase
MAASRRTPFRFRKSFLEWLEDRRLLTINIDLDLSTGPTIEQYGWDIKGGANIRDQSRSDHYHSTGANILRVPFFPTAHNQDGTINESDYSNHLRDISLARNSNPDLKIFASLKLRGAATFPAWMESGETCKIFGNSVFKPEVDLYTDALVDYVEYFHANGVKIDAFGINNEVENCLTPSRYSAAVESFRTKLSNTSLPAEYRSFDFVGPDAFRVSTAVNYVGGISNPSDVIDIAGIHFYAGSSDRDYDLRDLDNLVGGDMWFTEVHMNPSNASKENRPKIISAICVTDWRPCSKPTDKVRTRSSGGIPARIHPTSTTRSSLSSWDRR